MSKIEIMSRVNSKFCHLIQPVKITKDEHQRIVDIFNLLKKEISEEILLVENSEKKICSPKEKFSVSSTLLSFDKMDLIGPTVELNGKVYKMVKKEALSSFTALWQTGILQCFMKKRWIPAARISNYYSEDYPLILEIEYLSDLTNIRHIPTIQKRKEMCLFIVFLCYILNGTGYQISDPHSGNFGLSSDRTYYFDFGSFVKTEKKVSQYSLVIGGLETILFSFFPKSLLSTWDMFTSRSDFTSRVPRELTYEYLKYSRKYINFHLLHSSKCAYKASKRIFKYFICDPSDLMILLFDKKDFSEERIRQICQFD